MMLKDEIKKLIDH